MKKYSWKNILIGAFAGFLVGWFGVVLISDQMFTTGYTQLGEPGSNYGLVLFLYKYQDVLVFLMLVLGAFIGSLFKKKVVETDLISPPRN